MKLALTAICTPASGVTSPGRPGTGVGTTSVARPSTSISNSLPKATVSRANESTILNEVNLIPMAKK